MLSKQMFFATCHQVRNFLFSSFAVSFKPIVKLTN